MQLLKTLQKHLNLQLPQTLEHSGEIQQKDFRTKYVFDSDSSGKTVLDFLIFGRDGFPPDHKRIDDKGEIQELENFEFSLMYEISEERKVAEQKMNCENQKTAEQLIRKGLADGSEDWIQKYL